MDYKKRLLFYKGWWERKNETTEEQGEWLSEWLKKSKRTKYHRQKFAIREYVIVTVASWEVITMSQYYFLKDQGSVS